MRKQTVIAIFALMALLPVSGALAQLGDDTPEHDARVAKSLKEAGVKYTIDEDGDYKVIFDTGNGRTQLAYVRSATNEYRNFEVREIWSFGYRAEGDRFPALVANALLEDTFSKKLGAWTKSGSSAIFVVRLSAAADSESLFSALNLAVTSADAMEEKLTGDKDQF